MQKERFDTARDEISFLKEEKKKRPELFEEVSYIDDNDFLGTFGIHIPGKDVLPHGFIKYRPEDFIVEEIDATGDIQTVSMDKISLYPSGGRTLFATLVKCGISTIEAQEDLARLLNVKASHIRYAGIKDKDALTAQKISITDIAQDKFKEIRSPYFFLKNIYKGSGIVGKGSLAANRFTILIRIADNMGDKEKMDSFINALEKVMADGFYNFYYLQRFGNPRLNNFRWGISMLKGDYKSAVEGYLADIGIRENLYFAEKRRRIGNAIPHWDDILSVLSELPGIFSNEIKVSKHLAGHPDDYIGALSVIPDQVTLWIYAVSSYLFNRRVSSYLTDGLEPPSELPLFLNTDQNDWRAYEDDLRAFGVFPPRFENLEPFPKIRIGKNIIKTRDQAEINAVKIVPEGVIIQFSLGKGSYATTFLSHLVNLVSGKVPEKVIDSKIDIKAVIGQENLSKTITYFEDVSRSKREI